MRRRALVLAASIAMLPLVATPASHAVPSRATIAVDDTTWRAVSTLTGFAELTDYGYSVAVSGDTLVVGARQTDSYKGAVYVYQRFGDTWSNTPVATLTPPAGAGLTSRFGESVAIDGSTLVVGAPYLDRGPDTSAGAVYVYNGSGATWGAPTEILEPGVDLLANARFGSAVAIQGETLVVGARGKYTSNTLPGRKWGAAYVFARSGGAWDAGTRLTPVLWPTGGHKDQEFGSAVAVNGDTVLVGAPGGTGDAVADLGQVAQFYRNGSPGVWSQMADLPRPGPVVAGDEFGATLQMDATTVLASAPTTDPGADFPAAPVLYQYSGSGYSWTLVKANTAADPGPYVAFAADSAVLDATHVYAGYTQTLRLGGSQFPLGPGAVYIWGPENP